MRRRIARSASLANATADQGCPDEATRRVAAEFVGWKELINDGVDRWKITLNLYLNSIITVQT